MLNMLIMILCLTAVLLLGTIGIASFGAIAYKEFADGMSHRHHRKQLIH